MNIDANGENEAAHEGRDMEHGVFGEKQSSFPDPELRVDTANEVVRVGAGSGLPCPSSLHVQQQPQATVVCWARFLHVESIRVLLVENDDSTRHVVTALLRNCNYEVLEAANGLQAWKILEDLNTRIDLVLTEVVMPYLPGIPLLSKIMSHKTRKNIPVIMMSSHDSMGLVFKCLSKGAVDFLVKPIRKNELKNLWRHVWRRCHSSSGSGSVSVSESGTQTKKLVKSKNSEKSDNSGSGDGENDMSNGLDVGDASDDGSGTQSSWTKQAVEVDSSEAMSPMDQVAECQDSTCAQVIRSNAENSGYKRVHISVARGGHEQKPDSKDLEAIIPRNTEPISKNPVAIGSKVKPSSEFDCDSLVEQTDTGQEKLIAECSFRKHKDVDETSNPLIDGRESDSTTEVANILDSSNKEPNLELSLKRLRGAQDTGKSIQEERFVLRRSEQSAFSRYNTSSNNFMAPNGNTGSSSMIDNCTEVATKLELVPGIRAHSTDHPVYFSSNGVSNNLDIGSTTNILPNHPSSMKDESETTSATNGLQPSAFRPIKNDFGYCPPQVLQSHHHNFHQNRHSHHFNKLEQQSSSNHDDSSSKKVDVDPSQCGSTNVVCEAMECNLKDNSLNRSATGSNHVSKVVNAVGAKGESDVGRAGKSGSGDGSGSGNKFDEDKIARRIAALSKFHQKKKDRCFTKKVRYHNRKKLAEQRPRVRGQFVKQSVTDSSNKKSDE